MSSLRASCVPARILALCLLHAALIIPVAAADPVERLAKGVCRRQLDNGLVCIARQDPSVPVVSVQVWVGTGSAGEGEYAGGGLSHLIEHMIFKGTAQRGPADITREINDAGGEINAYTTLDRTVFWADMPAEKWLIGLDVLCDAVLYASFPEGEWKREKEVVRREMAMVNDNPERVLSRLLWQTAYQVHPYRFPVIGRTEIFDSLSRADLVEFHRRHYTPDNMIVSVAGNVPSGTVMAEVEKRFAGAGRRARPMERAPTEPRQMGPRFARKTGAYGLSRIAMAWHTVELSHPDAPALDVLSLAVGGGASSRLEQEIKETRKLAFEIGAWSFTPREPGLFGITAAFDPAKESVLSEAVAAQVSLWRTNELSTAEIEKARRKLRAGALRAFETAHGQAETFASGEFYAGSPRFFVAYLERLDSVTGRSVREAAERHLRDDNLTTAVVSPGVEAVSGAETADLAPEEVKIVRDALPNGLTLLCREDRRLPFVDICLAALGGLTLENEKNNGITRLMSELLPRGSPGRSRAQIAEETESRGGSLAPFSGMNSYGLRAGCFEGDEEVFMDIVADACLAPDFKPEEIAKCKEVQKAAIARARESPFFLGQEAVRGALFPNHPYRFNVEGSAESIESISREDLLALHGRTMVGSNAVLAVFGDISAARAKELALKYFSRMPAGARQDQGGSSAGPLGRPCRIELTAPREQAIVLAGFAGLSLADGRNDAADIIVEALNGLSSDLMIEVRDRRGLAYYAGAYHRPGLAAGYFAVYAGTRAGAEEKVCALIAEETKRLMERGLRADEFQRAQRQLAAESRRKLQSNGALAMECALNELYGLGFARALEAEKRLRQVTPDDVRRAAAEIMQPARMVEVIVRPEQPH